MDNKNPERLYKIIEENNLNYDKNAQDLIDAEKVLDNIKSTREEQAKAINTLRIRAGDLAGYIAKAKQSAQKEEQIICTGDFLIIEFNSKGKEIGKRADIDGIADYLIKIHNFKTIYGKNSEMVYIYNGKYYEQKGKEQIKKATEMLLGVYAKNNIVNEVYEKIKRKTSIDKSEFDNIDCNLIPFENGIYDLAKKELLEHNPKYNFTFIIPHIFDKEKDCQKFKDFLSEVLYQEDIPLMQQIFGFLVYRKYFLKKGFIFRGEKDTGKTTLLNIMIEFIGGKNKTSIPLQKISGNNDFTKLSLKDKHLNCYDDLSAQDLKDTAGFKIATGGGYISAEEKFGDYCQFMSFAKQIFATNKIPPINDNDEAYFGRWIVIEFDNVISKPDPFILQKILSEEEMSGIINWALEGLFRLLENCNFNYNKTLQETKLIMERSGNPLCAFVQDCLIENIAGRISKEEMEEIYNLYASHENLPRLSKEQLGRQLPKKATFILDKRDNGRYWANVSIKPFGKYYDTLDTFLKTFKKNLEVENSNYKNNNITSEKASSMSKNTLKNGNNKGIDTLDTFKEKDKKTNDLDIDFSKSGIMEALENE